MKRINLLLLSFTLLIGPFSYGQWSDQNSGVSSTLNDVHFIDEQEGWAVGRSGTIVHTSDGGGSWSTQNSGTNEDLTGVHMVGSSVGYAVGKNGTCVKYDGNSWSSVPLGHSQDVFNVHFVDASTGWVSGSSGFLQKTTDGGSNWTDEGGALSDYYDVHMLSSTEGWAASDNGNVSEYDGSSSWSSTGVAGSTDNFEAIHFSSSSNGFVVGEKSLLYHYDGASWTQHSTPLSGDQFITDVHAVDNNTAYATVDPGFGGEGKILKYDGTTWSKDYEYTGAGSELFYGVDFPSSSKGYAVGSSGMIKSWSSNSTALKGQEGELLQPHVGPDPFQDRIQLRYELGVRSERKIELYDPQGAKVLHRSARAVEEGAHREIIDASGLSEGVYFLRLSTDQDEAVLKIVKAE